ncbi:MULTISPECIES: hypothetical protein [unclassified Streptomyces]|uniref:hypothetical protein n=1 Tax=unclassified Streptomyces TaxID=2593676 RepID=UPI001CEC6794|nr:MULTISPECIES: hypothetical protein [unclassified Streptomyces]
MDGIDRPDEDTSDQGFACLWFGVIESVGEVRSGVVVERAGSPAQVPISISLHSFAGILAPGTDKATAGRAELVRVAFPTDVRLLADEALARIAGNEAGSVSNWGDQEDSKQWRAMLGRLRAVLAPPPPSFALFDVQP